MVSFDVLIDCMRINYLIVEFAPAHAMNLSEIEIAEDANSSERNSNSCSDDWNNLESKQQTNPFEEIAKTLSLRQAISMKESSLCFPNITDFPSNTRGPFFTDPCCLLVKMVKRLGESHFV